MKFRDLIEQRVESGTDMPQEIIALSEAAFSKKNMDKVVKLYSKIMGKRMGGTFKPIGLEEYKRTWGPGKGFRVINNAGAQLRFNWDQKLAKKALYDLTSVDYWAPKNTDFQKPTRTVRFAPELNVIQILDKVTDALLTGSINEANEILAETNLILEKRSSIEKSEWMKQNGFPASYTKEEKMRQQVQSKAPELSEQLEAFLGSPETNTFEGNLKKVQKQFDNQVYADPETVFEDIEDLLGLVASKKWRTLIVCGQGGIGKCLQGEQSVNVEGFSAEQAEIKDIFDKISEKEKHDFVLNQQYKNKTEFKIETINGYVPVVAMMIKEDIGVVLKCGEDSKDTLLVSKLHRISTPSGISYVKELKVGDTISHKTGEKEITEITETDTVLVYDLTIDSEDHLFLDSNGYIHHNTFHITEGPRSLPKLLGPEGDKWTYHSGTKASPLSFYKTLFMERNKVIVFDEADAILKHSEIIMMLKPILDTSGKNLAEYLTGTQNMVGKTDDQIAEYSEGVERAIIQGATVVKQKTKKTWDPLTMDLENDMSGYDVLLPSKFKFSGGMVFISNMKSSQIEQAIMSRSIFVDVYLAEQDVLKRIQSIGYAIAKNSEGTDVDDVDDVLEALGSEPGGKEHEITYMTPEYARKSKQVTVRALQLGLILRKSGINRWKSLVALYA